MIANITDHSPQITAVHEICQIQSQLTKCYFIVREQYFFSSSFSAQTGRICQQQVKNTQITTQLAVQTQYAYMKNNIQYT